MENITVTFHKWGKIGAKITMGNTEWNWDQSLVAELQKNKKNQ